MLQTNTLYHMSPPYSSDPAPPVSTTLTTPTALSVRPDVHAFLMEEDGVGVVEIILILVVLISLVIIFKNQLTSLVTSILSKITSQSNSI